MGSYFSYAEKIEDVKTETIDHFENFLKILRNVDVSKLSVKQRKILEDVELSFLTGDLSQSIEECEDVEKMKELIFEQRRMFAGVLECFVSLLVNGIEVRGDDLTESVQVRIESAGEERMMLKFHLEKLFQDEEVRNSILDEWKVCFEKDHDWLKIILEEYSFMLSSELFADRPKRVLNRVKYWETNLFQKIYDEDLRRKFRDERSGFILRCTDKKDAEKVIARTFVRIREMEEEQKMSMIRGSLQNELREALQKRLEIPEPKEPIPDLKSWSSESCDESGESFDDFQISRAKSAAKPIPKAKRTLKLSFSVTSSSDSSEFKQRNNGKSDFVLPETSTTDASETSETLETTYDSEIFTMGETKETSETSESVDTNDVSETSESSETLDTTDASETSETVDTTNASDILVDSRTSETVDNTENTHTHDENTTESSEESTPLPVFAPPTVATNSSEDSDDTSELSFLESNSSSSHSTEY